MSTYANKMAAKRIRLTFKDGMPVARQAVDVKQVSHDFKFGCGAFDAVELVNAADDDPRLGLLTDRMEKWLELFNYGTLPFYWGRFEAERGKPQTQELLKAAKWLNSKNIIVKGHPLCWHTVTAPWLMELSNEDILKAQLDRIRREVSDFKGVIDIWDVINEVVIMPIFDKYDNGITRVCKMLGRVQLIKEVFAAAREANPSATLLLNDFNTSDEYRLLIEGCLDAGVPIDVIGIQSHQHQGYWGLDKLHEVLDRFSAFGLPIHFTENTLVSGYIMPAFIRDLNDWQVPEWPTTPDGEARQARELMEMYGTLFAHPLVDAVTIWDHTDGKWLGAPSGVLRVDNSRKPAAIALKQRIENDWTTRLTVVSDDDGYVEWTGFRGKYELGARGECWHESI